VTIVNYPITRVGVLYFRGNAICGIIFNGRTKTANGFRLFTALPSSPASVPWLRQCHLTSAAQRVAPRLVPKSPRDRSRAVSRIFFAARARTRRTCRERGERNSLSRRVDLRLDRATVMRSSMDSRDSRDAVWSCRRSFPRWSCLPGASCVTMIVPSRLVFNSQVKNSARLLISARFSTFVRVSRKNGTIDEEQHRL